MTWKKSHKVHMLRYVHLSMVHISSLLHALATCQLQIRDSLPFTELCLGPQGQCCSSCRRQRNEVYSIMFGACELQTGYLNTVCVAYMTPHRQAVVLCDTTVAYWIRSEGHCLTPDTITYLTHYEMKQELNALVLNLFSGIYWWCLVRDNLGSSGEDW